MGFVTMAVLARIMVMMEKVWQQVPGMVTEENVYRLAETWMRLTRYRDASRFFTFPPKPQPPPPPSPEQVLAMAQIEDAKIKRRSEIEKGRTDRLKVLLENDRERDKNEASFFIELGKLLVAAHQPIEVESLKQEGLRAMTRQRSLEDYMNTVMAEQSAGQPEAQEEAQEAAQAGQQMQGASQGAPQGAPMQ